MVWTSQHDQFLCREILVEEPYRFKAGTREKGHAWDKIATHLNAYQEVRFIVDQRAVRDRYLKIEKNYKRKMLAEESASGISPDVTELDQAIESIVKRSEGAHEEIEKVGINKRKQAEKERENAESMRKRAMERLAETREREGSASAKKKRRSVGSDAVEHLTEKSLKETELRREEIELKKREQAAKERMQEEEIELRKRELDLREREQEIRQRKDERLFTLFQQQQMQMQQQNQAILALLADMKKN